MPFETEDEARAKIDESFKKIPTADLLEAFGAYTPIGDKKAMRDNFAASRSGWEREEQAGVADASEAILDELAELNSVYCDKYGYVFLVCATGKSAEEMLAILKERLPNHPALEMDIASGELLKITHLRFGRLLLEGVLAAPAGATARGGDDEGGGHSRTRPCSSVLPVVGATVNFVATGRVEDSEPSVRCGDGTASSCSCLR